MVCWASGTGDTELHFGQQVTVVEPVSGATSSTSNVKLNAAPVFVRDLPGSLVTKARSNLGRRFPWGGDYSSSRSVSIEFGSATKEQGLHTLAGEVVADAVIGYGGSARAGGVPGGNLFIVDPGFLSYSPTPIEITIVVRRNQDNDNAGFKLVYESTEGFKTAGGWYTIPDNQRWHTVKRRIDDAQFNGYWGYHFSLVSDGDVYNKYFIQSVKVTKL